MAFPLTPSIGQYHTELGLRYKWTGASWDLLDTSNDNQIVITSTVDPVTGVDTASHVGAIWRNTATGKAFRYETVLGSAPLVQEWNPIKESPDFQVSLITPTISSIGSSLKEGDIWVESTEGRVYFRSAANTWMPLNAFYDNTVVNALTSSYTGGAINEIDSIFDSTIINGSRFIGTYAPSTNTADFVASTSYADGTLPAANTLLVPDFLVVTEQAVGQAPAPTVQMYKGDFLLADPVTNTWIHYQFGALPLSYLLLGDTPSSYATFGQQLIRVNATETGMELALQGTDKQTNYSAVSPGTFIDSDLWVDSTSKLESVATGGQWLYTSPVSVTTGVPPANPFNGALWYDRFSSTLYIYDASITPASWVGV